MTIRANKPFKQNGAEAFYHKALRGLAFETYRRIVLKTARKTGRAAGNWQISINVPAPTVPNYQASLLPLAGTVSTQELGKLKPSAVVNFPTIIISNALPYIIPLEYGSSSQAPAGMVRVTLAEITGMGS